MWMSDIHIQIYLFARYHNAELAADFVGMLGEVVGGELGGTAHDTFKLLCQLTADHDGAALW